MFEDIFGSNNLFGEQGLSELDRQQAKEAARLSGLTEKKMQQFFYGTFLNARKARKINEALKI